MWNFPGTNGRRTTIKPKAIAVAAVFGCALHLAFAQCLILEADLTKGQPADQRFTIQSPIICEKKFGDATDWVLDDRTEHRVRAELRNKVMTWSNHKGA
jgi:hypothetical protein